MNLLFIYLVSVALSLAGYWINYDYWYKIFDKKLDEMKSKNKLAVESSINTIGKDNFFIISMVISSFIPIFNIIDLLRGIFCNTITRK